jgi:hypothetical protein
MPEGQSPFHNLENTGAHAIRIGRKPIASRGQSRCECRRGAIDIRHEIDNSAFAPVSLQLQLLSDRRIGLSMNASGAFFDGRFPAMPSSVRNHVGDLYIGWACEARYSA